jgi:hypothetical protein
MVPRVPFQELALLIKLLHVPAHCTLYFRRGDPARLTLNCRTACSLATR